MIVKGIILWTVLTVALSIEFQQVISMNQMSCFSQFISESTPFHVRASTAHGNFTLKMLLNNGTVLFNHNHKESTKKIDSYSAMDAEYSFCIENEGKQDLFDVKFYEGLELADLKSVARQDQAKVLDSVVRIIQEKHQSIKIFGEKQSELSGYMMEVQKNVSFKTVGFGFLSVAVILIVSFLHYTIIKRLLRNRKIV